MMRQLNKWQNVVFAAGAVLMAAGAGLYVFAGGSVAAAVSAAGASAFASMQLLQTYDGGNLALRRLRRILTVADVMFIISAVLMLEDTLQLLLPLFVRWFDNGYYAYLTYVRNNWVVLLLAAAIIEIYATHRISHELKKEES